MQSSTLYNGDTKAPFNPSSNVNNVNGFNGFAQKPAASSNVNTYNEAREASNGSNNGLRTSQPTQQRQIVSETPNTPNTPNTNGANSNGSDFNVMGASEAAATNVKLIKNQGEQQRGYRGRNLSIEIQRTRLNKLRPYLEKLKKPFEESVSNLRLADPIIIDAMLRCAEVSTSVLKEHLEKAYSKPAYLPPEDEVFTLPLEEPQFTRRDRRDNRNSNLRVDLSFATSSYLSSIQRELTEEMGSQPDLNAVANALIDLATHRPRQIVLTISEHYEEVVKNQKIVS